MKSSPQANAQNELMPAQPSREVHLFELRQADAIPARLAAIAPADGPHNSSNVKQKTSTSRNRCSVPGIFSGTSEASMANSVPAATCANVGIPIEMTSTQDQTKQPPPSITIVHQ
ncbi:MAG: hypothetical protein KGN16_13490 [Burkholderiales bacterium]|nr:hypothetical protein [Burkholderiales bacterium]